MGLCAEIGVGLTGLGFLFLMLGVLFFFDRGLLAMGNVSGPVSRGRCHHGLSVALSPAFCSVDSRRTCPVPNARLSACMQRHGATRCRVPCRVPSHRRTNAVPSPPSPQVLFLSGVALTIGPAAALRFFIR